VGASYSIMANDCELVKTWLLVLVNTDLKLTDMMYLYLEHVIDMCE